MSAETRPSSPVLSKAWVRTSAKRLKKVGRLNSAFPPSYPWSSWPRWRMNQTVKPRLHRRQPSWNISCTCGARLPIALCGKSWKSHTANHTWSANPGAHCWPHHVVPSAPLGTWPSPRKAALEESWPHGGTPLPPPALTCAVPWHHQVGPQRPGPCRHLPQLQKVRFGSQMKGPSRPSPQHLQPKVQSFATPAQEGEELWPEEPVARISGQPETTISPATVCAAGKSLHLPGIEHLKLEERVLRTLPWEIHAHPSAKGQCRLPTKQNEKLKSPVASKDVDHSHQEKEENAVGIDTTHGSKPSPNASRLHARDTDEVGSPCKHSPDCELTKTLQSPSCGLEAKDLPTHHPHTSDVP